MLLKERTKRKIKRKIKNLVKEKPVSFILVFVLMFSIAIYIPSYSNAKESVILEKYFIASQEYQKAWKNEYNKTKSDIVVTISNTLIKNNSVGNEWYIENYANNTFVDRVGRITLKFGNPITVETYIAEDDTWPDSAKNKYSHTFSREELINGCSITQTTYVIENNGRYVGNSAKWETKYDFKAVMNYPEKPTKDEFSASFFETNKKMFENLFG